MRTLLVVLFLILSTIQAHPESFCGIYDLKHITETATSVGRKLQEGQWEPIRIYVDFTTAEKQTGKNQNLAKIKQAVKNVTDTFSKILKVQRLSYFTISPSHFTGTLRTDGITDHDPQFDGRIEKYDIVIFAVYKQLSEGTVMSAGPRYLSTDGRPLTGILNIAESIDYTKQNLDLFLQKTILHEFTHVLVFIQDLFSRFKGGNCRQSVNVDGVTRYKIKSQKVLEKAKLHFGCDNIDGIFLEDQGGSGTVGAHWEARFMLTDYMVGVQTGEMTISELTLALFEDSGWYQANYYTGGIFRFGKGMGCSFLDEKCIDPSTSKTKFKNDFLNKDQKNQEMCFSGRLTCGHGYIVKYIGVNEKYNYFGDGESYGWQTADFCPVAYNIAEMLLDDYGGKEVYPYNYANCNVGTGDFFKYHAYLRNGGLSEPPSGYLPTVFDSSFSEHSFCAIFSATKQKGSYYEYTSDPKDIYYSRCFEMFCTDSALTIKVDDVYVVCPKEGGAVKIRDYYGKFLCPDYNLICTGTVMCNELFDCVEKKSEPKQSSFDYTSYKNGQILTNQNMWDADNAELVVAHEESENGKCPKGCSSCLVSNGVCIRCGEGFDVVRKSEDSEEILKCTTVDNTEGLYQKNGIYYPCLRHCKQCTDANTCQECDEDSDKISDTECRFKGIEYCKTHTDSTNSRCEICEDGYYMFEGVRTVCEQKDISSYYLGSDKTYHECSKEITGCLKCKSKGTCDACQADYLVVVDNNSNKCVKEDDLINLALPLNATHYAMCNTFIPNCEFCEDKNKCASCEDGYDFENGNDFSKCVKVGGIIGRPIRNNNAKYYVYSIFKMLMILLTIY